ncbi:MAG: Ig-like domain-containing protein [Ruminococcus sp.]|nr:Ig-like domain-containing protein [Ruminococcus sp.]MDD5890194.1 Ig-like domain-containing protein [Ruminococcus sp.]
MKKLLCVIMTVVLFATTIATVCGATLDFDSDEYVAPLNSWRYKNGVPRRGIESVGASKSSNAWKKTSKGFVNNYGQVIQGATMKGIDVSQWNGNINWAKVAKSDVDYAIIRVGYGDNYTYQDDTYFKKNVQGCIDNKIPFGVYIYSYAVNTTMAKSEANHVLRLINGLKLDFPVYFDMEDNSQLNGTNSSTRGSIAKTFCNAITAKGYKVGIYANLNWWNNYLTDKAFNNSKWYKWVAQYNSQCDYKGTYQMWQSTSSGVIDGVSSACGTFDFNFWFGKTITSSYAQPVKLSNTNYTFKYYGEELSKKLTATVYTTDKEKGVKWSSSNKDVATVDSNGKVVAKGQGTCYITARAKFDTKKLARCKVKVQQMVTGVKSSKNIVSLEKPGSSYTLKATCTPTNADDKSVKWKSSNTLVATVNAVGKILAKKKGSCTVTATTNDGTKLTTACKVTVKKQTVTKVALSKKSVALNRGKKLTLKATCTPTNAYNKSVTWSTNNKNVAVVNSKGKVTAKRKGTCYITATAKDGSKKYARCKVVVK